MVRNTLDTSAMELAFFSSRSFFSPRQYWAKKAIITVPSMIKLSTTMPMVMPR